MEILLIDFIDDGEGRQFFGCGFLFELINPVSNFVVGDKGFVTKTLS